MRSNKTHNGCVYVSEDSTNHNYERYERVKRCQCCGLITSNKKRRWQR